MSNVLVYADADTIAHKHRGEVPAGHDCYWTVSGTPRQTSSGEQILFTDGDRVIAAAPITGVEEGRIWFEPLQTVDRELPAVPVTRGFKYVNS